MKPYIFGLAFCEAREAKNKQKYTCNNGRYYCCLDNYKKLIIRKYYGGLLKNFFLLHVSFISLQPHWWSAINRENQAQ